MPEEPRQRQFTLSEGKQNMPLYREKYKETPRSEYSMERRPTPLRYGCMPKANRHGISRVEYLKMMDYKACEVCGNPPSGKDLCLAFDHDHKSGKVRDALPQCNSALGLANEDLMVLRI